MEKLDASCRLCEAKCDLRNAGRHICGGGLFKIYFSNHKYLEFTLPTDDGDHSIRDILPTSKLTKICPVVQLEGVHRRRTCLYAHNKFEFEFWQFCRAHDTSINAHYFCNKIDQVDQDPEYSLFDPQPHLFNLIKSCHSDQAFEYVSKFLGAIDNERAILWWREPVLNQTILHVACQHRATRVVQFLLKHWARALPGYNDSACLEFFNHLDDNGHCALDLLDPTCHELRLAVIKNNFLQKKSKWLQ